MKKMTMVLALALAISCQKKFDKETGIPLVINPTVNPIPYSVLVYLITPTDKTFSAEYYKGVKACALSLQTWYKLQMDGKGFIMNQVVVDTLTGLHNSIWYSSDNGFTISGNGSHAYHNTLYEMQQLLGAKFNKTNYTYFVFVASDFPNETIPKGLAALGLNNLINLSGKSPNSTIGACGHELGHAFGLPEPPGVVNPQAIMSTGYPKYPNCILQQAEKDSLNATPFFK